MVITSVKANIITFNEKNCDFERLHKEKNKESSRIDSLHLPQPQ